MEQPPSDLAFLIRFRATPDAGGESGVVTHVQSGQRFEFASFLELERLVKKLLTSSGVPTTDQTKDSGDHLG